MLTSSAVRDGAARAVEKDTDRAAYRPFRVTVSRLERLTPHFVRVTFTGDDLDLFGRSGLDQRIKLVLPVDGRFGDIGIDDDASHRAGEWYTRWRELPEHERNPFRTYTVRAIRPERFELDVDFVDHGDGGPAAHWLQRASIGDEVVVVGPDERSPHSRTGLDWHPGDAKRVLLIGDETAVPAIGSILAALPAHVEADVLLEVPHAHDAMPLACDGTANVTWLPRQGAASGPAAGQGAASGPAAGRDAPNGSLLEAELERWIDASAAVYSCAVTTDTQPIAEIDVDVETLWDSPLDGPGDFYAWIAGEASSVKRMRRRLVTDLGIDRSRVAFMGYWRLGRAEPQG